MTDFNKIADTYDLMINWPARLAREMPFFEKIIADKQIKSILDIGCATGNHARAFAELGITVTAVDPSEEMLRIAKETSPGINPVFEFGGLGIFLPDGKYDMAVILGNTATLTESLEKFEEAICDLYQKLISNGALIIQIVNYDKIIKQQILAFPAMKKKRGDTEYIFLREYRMVEGCPELTVATVEMRGDEIKHRFEHTRHIPLNSERFADILSRAGFITVKFYEDYNYTPFNAELSGSLIAIVEK